MNVLCDQTQRQSALNIDQSFIVQAPAGSGKTELLVQRALKCLLHVDFPEQVMVLTFTKKASIEINERIHNYILDTTSRTKRQPETQKLLKLLDRHIVNKSWDLNTQSTFAICKTFDGFTHSIQNLDITLVSHPYFLYEQTVNEILYGDYFSLLQEDLKPILSLLNYDHEKLHKLLLDLIAKRDQWLSPLLDERIPVREIYTHFTEALISLVNAHVDDSFKQLLELSKNHIRLHSVALNEWKLRDWQCIAEIFMTKKLEWRKRLTNQDLPDINASVKGQIKDLLSIQSTDLAKHIAYLSRLPEQLSDDHATILKSLQNFLPKVCALLNMDMQQKKRCDFTYLTIKAIDLLNQDDIDQTIALHHTQINHLLIDEFQDTSQLQAVLIESLIAHWPEKKNHSLFIVGDPMQSIYKFRQADVRLFTQVQTHGLGNLKLKAISLSTNFRSTHTLVKHFNDTYAPIFPEKNDVLLGGIHYHPATAANNVTGSVAWWKSMSTDALIAYLNAIPESESIAILARSRAHLLPIYTLIPERVCAPGLFSLYEYPWIQELSAILIHIYAPDEISNLGVQRLAILKKPWSKIFNKQFSDTEISFTKAIEAARLKIDYYEPSNVLIPIARAYLPNHFHHPVSQFFYEQIDCMQAESIELNRKNIQHILTHLKPDHSPDHHANIHLMTIHQSKGLEFDHVIIPNVEARVMPDQDQLLHWFQFNPHKPMMIGTIQTNHTELDPINQTLRNLSQQSYAYETSRLLYVAATRAKKSLRYIGDSEVKSKSFATLLKKANLLPIDHDLEYQSVANLTPKLQNEKNMAALPTTINNMTTKSMAIPNLEHHSSLLGTAIHHLLETMIKLKVPLAHAYKDSRLIHLLNHYATTLNNTEILNFFSTLKSGTNAQWLFQNYERQLSELTLYGNQPTQTIRIDYVLFKNHKVYLIDFKTNTQNIEPYYNQLEIYQCALASYLNRSIDQTIIFNPLTDETFDILGKRVLLEQILC